ncbi:LIC_13387 family protein [Bradyrhizobium sp. NC92]|uniref:LIC_13387 family protein n=1 Tax=Bradyrhizobium sp. (strain NC92) TaxID=55395 RepID=UPI00390652E4
MIMARGFLSLGATVFLTLGTYHLFLILRDQWVPRALVPVDHGVRTAMERARLGLSPDVLVWDAWVGFNISHSVSLILFGGAFLTIAWKCFPDFALSPSLQFTAIAVAGLYVGLSLRYWFWGPAVGTGLGLACFVAAAICLHLTSTAT